MSVEIDKFTRNWLKATVIFLAIGAGKGCQTTSIPDNVNVEVPVPAAPACTVKTPCRGTPELSLQEGTRRIVLPFVASDRNSFTRYPSREFLEGMVGSDKLPPRTPTPSTKGNPVY